MKKIAYWNLVRQIQHGKITERTARRAFVLRPDAAGGSRPVFVINEETVDLSGLAALPASSGDDLAWQADTLFRQRKEAKLATFTEAPAIVAEGDSWFKLPWWYQQTVIDALSEKYRIQNLAHWGDTLSAMLSAGEYVPHIANARFLLWSGGGNDILGDTFADSINHYDGIHKEPSDAGFYVNATFHELLASLDRSYRRLASDLSRHHPKLKIVVHGYDFAIPGPDGMFLGKHFQNRGFSPAHQEPLCRAIVKLMVKAFNQKLSSIAGHHPNFVHVNLTDQLARNDWLDELHPKYRAASGKLAAKFEQILGKPDMAPVTS